MNYRHFNFDALRDTMRNLLFSSYNYKIIRKRVYYCIGPGSKIKFEPGAPRQKGT